MTGRTMKLVMTGLLLLAMAGQPRAQAEQTPEDVIVTVFSDAVELLIEREDELRDNLDLTVSLIDQTLSPHVQVPLMSQLILTTHWRTASPEQQARFVAAFRQHLLRTYARLLLDNLDEVIETVGRDESLLRVRSSTEPDRRGRVTVRTDLELVDEVLPIDYRLIAIDDGWQIWDIVIENISFVINYRDEFGSRADALGLEGLIAELEDRDTTARAGSEP